MSMQVGNIGIYMGPKDVGAPDDLGATIIKFIDQASTELLVAVQEIDNPDIADSLIRARKRKVLVKVVTEHDYVRSARAKTDPKSPGGPLESNREILNWLLRANIDAKLDYNGSIFHQKFIVRDRMAVLTGSTNFTITGTTKNLNHIVILNDPRVAKHYRKEFEEISQGHFGKLNEGHDPAPSDVVVSDVPVRILFAPDHNPELEITKQMAKAKKRIDFAIFTFSQSSAIDDQMLLVARAGCKIRGALDLRMGMQKWAPTKILASVPNIELHTVAPSSSIGKLHHKLMVIDEETIIAGSFNYTGPANRLNDENIVILGDLDTKDQSQRAAQKKLGQYALDEISRIIVDYGKEYRV